MKGADVTTPDELLPCPFCGGEPIVGIIEDGSMAFVECSRHIDSSHTATSYGDTPANAAARWNIRAPESAPNGLADEIRAFLADAPKGKPHKGYRYGELLAAAEAALRNQPGGAAPREPTREMTEAGAAAYRRGLPSMGLYSLLETSWLAMYDAATKDGK